MNLARRLRRSVNSLLFFIVCIGPLIAQQAVAPPVPSADAKPADGATVPVPSPFRITGTVINSITKSPVRGAELNAAPMSGRRANTRGAGRTQGQGNTAVTDAAGRFAIEVPTAGGWSLTASAHGYHTQAFDEHENYSTAIVLSEAAPVFDLTFRLPPASAIEGYVVDEAGEPVRNGQLMVSLIPPASPEDAHPRHQSRGNQRTDDRGYFKFSGLLAGDYEIRLQAQPWYATGALGQRFGGGIGGGIVGTASNGSGSNTSTASAPDPLDVVYPTVWYPGVTEFTAAEPITLRPGEIHEADFRLSPIPGFHLRIAAAPQTEETRRMPIQNSAYLTQIMPDGMEVGSPLAVRTDADGNLEVSGLAPGTYVVHRQGDQVSSAAATSTIQISPNSARTVDLSQATAATLVTLNVDPAADLPSLQITFRDLDNGRTTSMQDSRIQDGRGLRRRSSAAGGSAILSGSQPSERTASDKPTRTISLQPGRYNVSLSGIDDLHLAGIEATGATATGRIVTIAGGAPTLMLHVAAGRANITGFVRFSGTLASGAMVLLVPASLGDPSGLDVTRRDQSNTDGSFDILNVLPGAYILVAINHGWDVNWRDPASLRRFLMHGTPLDLSAPGDRKVTIEAQSP